MDWAPISSLTSSLSRLATHDSDNLPLHATTTAATSLSTAPETSSTTIVAPPAPLPMRPQNGRLLPVVAADKRPKRTQTNRWCHEMKFTAKDISEATHLLLNGGKLKVPQDKMSVLWGHMISDYNSGQHNYIVEIRCERGFRYVIDLDIDSQHGEVMEDEWQILISGVLRTIAEIYPSLSDLQRRVIVCRAPIKQRIKDGVAGTKTGRHLIFPEIYVDAETALQIRDMMILRARETQLLLECRLLREADIDELFDETIYLTNGFRMMLQNKAEICHRCGNRRKKLNFEDVEAWRAKNPKWRDEGKQPPKTFYYIFADCTNCQGVGYVHEGRPYTCHMVLSGNGDPLPDETRILQSNLQTLFEQTSVRIDDLQMLTRYDERLLNSLTTRRNNKNLRRRRVVDSSGKVVLDARTNPTRAKKGGGDWILISQTDPAFEAADKLIHHGFKHRSCDDVTVPDSSKVATHSIASLRRSKDGKKFIATSTSHYCKNKERQFTDMPEHNNSNVYFLIDDDTSSVVQKCHARRSYMGIRCEDFRSSPLSIPEDVRDKLWPPQLGEGSKASTMRDAEVADIVKINLERIAAMPTSTRQWLRVSAEKRQMLKNYCRHLESLYSAVEDNAVNVDAG